MIFDIPETVILHSSDPDAKPPNHTHSKLCEDWLREPNQNVLHDVIFLLVHNPVTSTLVIDNLGLWEELLHCTDAGLGARTVSGSTEEENWDVDRVGHWKVTG
jgi:hypothetical protein